MTSGSKDVVHLSGDVEYLSGVEDCNKIVEIKIINGSSYSFHYISENIFVFEKIHIESHSMTTLCLNITHLESFTKLLTTSTDLEIASDNGQHYFNTLFGKININGIINDGVIITVHRVYGSELSVFRFKMFDEEFNELSRWFKTLLIKGVIKL